MRAQGNHFESLFDCAIDGMLLIGRNGVILRANPAACRAVQRTEAEICQLGREGLLVDEPAVGDLIARRDRGESVVGPATIIRADGTTFAVEFTSGPLPSPGGEQLAYVTFRDVTHSREAEKRLRDSNRALAVMNRCSESWARADSESALYRAVSEALVETGGYRMCWIGQVERENRQKIRAVEWSGAVEGFFDEVSFTCDDTYLGQSPTGLALRHHLPVVGAAFEHDPRLAPWRAAAHKRGYARSTALPLCFQEGEPAVLTIYSAECDPPDPAEFQLQTRLAENMAAAVDGLRARVSRSKAETRVRHSEAMLRSIADTVPEPLFLKDSESRYLFVNAATLEVAGKGMSEVIGKTDLEIFPDQMVGEALLAVDRRVVTSGMSIIVEETVQAHDGYRIYETTKAPFRNAHGEVIGLVGNARDITARQREDAERRRLATAIEAAAETVVVTDEFGNIVYANPAFEQITGYTRAEALGRNPRLLKSGVQNDNFYRNLWATISGGRTWKGRLVNRRKSGQLYTEESSISPVRDAAGLITAYVSVNRDITQDLVMEGQLRQSQKMEGIGRLAGGVAHDFNNLLSVILTVTEMARENVKAGDLMFEDLSEIESAANRATALTRQLLALSRKQVLNTTAFRAFEADRAGVGRA